MSGRQPVHLGIQIQTPAHTQGSNRILHCFRTQKREITSCADFITNFYVYCMCHIWRIYVIRSARSLI